MRNAPNVKQLPKDPFTEAVIFAGADAYAHAKGWEEGLGKHVACDTTPPVYLGPKQLADLDNLRIVDDGRRAARVYLAGDIKQIQISAIADKLALAGVKEARLFKGIPDREPEKWDMDRVRDTVQRGESLVEMLKKEERATAAASLKDVHDMPMLSPFDFPYLSDKGQPLNTIPNLRCLLNHYGFTVRYDVIRKDLVIRYPGQHGTQDNTRETALNTVVSLCALNRLPKGDAPGFLLNIGDENLVNPVMDFITSKPWDGVSRFSELMDTVQTRESYDRNLLAMFLRRWMISAVAAAAKPTGFWSKGVLVFQGEQSLGKTAWIRSLVPEELRDLVKIDATINPDNKDTIISAVSHWICELGELDGTLRKSDIARLKGFISQDVDQFRRPYARTEGKYGRRTVFFASVNPEQFLADDTGNVRWWTVPVTQVNSKHEINMQQMWAEVFEWFKAGEQWWLDRDEEAALEAVNANHEQADPIEELISSLYDFPKPATRRLTATEILFEIGYDKPTRAQLNGSANAIKKHFGDWKKANGRKVYDVPPLKRDNRPY
ncbi:TPA: VapE domain-containing protein [Klebsiella michiganensis]